MASMTIARGLYAALLVAATSAQPSFTKVKAQSFRVLGLGFGVWFFWFSERILAQKAPKKAEC